MKPHGALAIVDKFRGPAHAVGQRGKTWMTIGMVVALAGLWGHGNLGFSRSPTTPRASTWDGRDGRDLQRLRTSVSTTTASVSPCRLLVRGPVRGGRSICMYGSSLVRGHVIRAGLANFICTVLILAGVGFVVEKRVRRLFPRRGPPD